MKCTSAWVQIPGVRKSFYEIFFQETKSSNIPKMIIYTYID